MAKEKINMDKIAKEIEKIKKDFFVYCNGCVC